MPITRRRLCRIDRPAGYACGEDGFALLVHRLRWTPMDESCRLPDSPDLSEGRPDTVGAVVSCCMALLNTPYRLLRPRRPDAKFLASLPDAPVPPARTTVGLAALPQGQTAAPAFLVAEGVRNVECMPMVYGSFIVTHPRARFLVDPALCDDVHGRVLPGHPFPLGLLTYPQRPVVGMAEALARRELSVSDIDFALATHLHWDHVAGLMDLPTDVQLRACGTEYHWATSGSSAPYGVVRAPLRNRTVAELDLDGPPVLTFGASHDLFGDGSVVLVDLAGHTPGSIGVLLAVDDGSRVLLAGDAVWNRLQISTIRSKAPMPGQLFDAQPDLTFRTVQRLHALPAGIEVIASHDYDAVLARA